MVSSSHMMYISTHSTLQSHCWESSYHQVLIDCSMAKMEGEEMAELFADSDMADRITDTKLPCSFQEDAITPVLDFSPCFFFIVSHQEWHENMPNRLLNQNGIGILWPGIVSPMGFVNEGECVPLLFSSRKMVRIVQQPRESKMRHLELFTN